MAASDAVRSTAIARKEVRASLERMEFHIARGPRGLKGVNREVRFLDALHRQTAQLGAKAVGQSAAVNARRSFGQEALSALRSGDGKSISRVKSSVLADFSADGLAAPRSIATRFPSWKWQANGSACPTCLSKHGNLYTGVFIPTHPSCLCIAASPSSDVRPLTEGEIIDMQAKYGDGRYKKLMGDLKAGRKTMSDIRAVENVNATRKGLAAVGRHNLEGIVRQNALPGGAPTQTGAVPRLRFSGQPAAVEVVEEVASEAVEPIKVFTGRTIEGKPTRAMKSAMSEAEQIMADAVGTHRGFLERAAARVERVKMTASKGKRKAQRHNGLWEETNLKRTGRGANRRLEKIDKRLSMEMNRSDFAAHNAWVKEHNLYSDRISMRQLLDTPAVRSTSTVRSKPPTFKPNPEFLPTTNDERFKAMEKWLKINPEPAAKFAAPPQALAETLLHELVHAADYSTGKSINGLDTVLRRKLKIDGIDRLAKEAYAAGDKAMWYAASRGKPGETIADITRMYFFGDRYDTVDQILKSAAEWRAAYPEMARWVEENVLIL